MDILPASGLPGSLFWCDAISFIVGSCQICHSLSSALTYGTSFIHALLSEMIRSLSLCRGTDRGRLGCCVHLLQLWFYSHLSVIARDQPEGFAIRSRVRVTVVLDLPFSRDTEG